MHQAFRIPAMAPRLPDIAACAGYLARIDENRWYSNFGPLGEELSARLAAHYRGVSGSVCLTSNATLALATALQDLSQGRVGGDCVVPSWTFAATAHAVCLAGLRPKFVDVDLSSGQLTPEIAESAMDERVAAVIAVSPFGGRVAPAPWEAFHTRHSVPVIIDAAAAFDTASLSSVPTIVSMHATKPVAAGEGGFVLCADTDFIERVRRRTNFGFDAQRVSQYTGLNAKLSEYGAAVGLAALDAWPKLRARLFDVGARYATRLAPLALILQEGWGESWISTTLNVRLARGADLSAARVSRLLAAREIDARLWWGEGCHMQPAFAGFERRSMTHTQELVARTLGLPFFADITHRDMDEVVDRLGAILAGSFDEAEAQ